MVILFADGNVAPLSGNDNDENGCCCICWRGWNAELNCAVGGCIEAGMGCKDGATYESRDISGGGND